MLQEGYWPTDLAGEQIKANPSLLQHGQLVHSNWTDLHVQALQEHREN